ncbi:MAG: 5-(carboxyamino)imidazole ribonucleotide synthase [Nitrosopumilaceae archaeon]
MAKILGIIGGGQLGMMLTEAAKKMPEHVSTVIVLDPTENCPAAKVGAKQIIADFKDEKAIQELATKSDILTYEIESGNSDVLKKLENQCEISPSPHTLQIIQDKFTQKSFLSENDIPVAEFIKIDSLTDLQNKIKDFGFPSLLKARRDAYDGRGNYKINSKEEINQAFEFIGNRTMFLEKFVDFKMEVSVIAARNTKGEISTFPVVENIHEENILKMTIAPARVSSETSEKAKQVATKTMEVLRGAGVFGIEMFVTKNDNIIINEIAPRVHNSGHHTLQSSKTSQFEQHLRAILGLELGDTTILHPTIMYNILGPNGFQGKYKPIRLNEENVFLKMYGKEESKPKRKLGHFNVVSMDSQSVDQLMKRVNDLKNQIKIVPENS